MILLDIILFVIGLPFGFLVFAMIVLPAFYSFPRSLFWYFNKRVRLAALFMSLVAPVLWSVVWFVVASYIRSFSFRFLGGKF